MEAKQRVDSKKLGIWMNLVQLLVLCTVICIPLLVLVMIWLPSDILFRVLFSDLVIFLVSVGIWRVEIFKLDRDEDGELIVEEKYRKE